MAGRNHKYATDLQLDKRCLLHTHKYKVSNPT